MWVRMHRKLRGTGAFTGLRLPNRSLRNEVEVGTSRQLEGRGHLPEAISCDRLSSE